MTAAVKGPLGTDPAARTTFANQAYEAIRDMLIRLEIRPGAAISEDALTERLGLGRTPVREAIKRLEADSLIAIYPRRGTFATEVNITDLALITEIRLALEPSAAALAARRANAAERSGLKALRSACTRPPRSDEALMNLDRRIHHAVYAASHNRFLEQNLTQYYSLVQRIWFLFLDRLPDLADHVSEHAQLLDAIIEGRADDAETIVREHVADFEKTVRAVI